MQLFKSIGRISKPLKSQEEDNQLQHWAAISFSTKRLCCPWVARTTTAAYNASFSPLRDLEKVPPHSRGGSTAHRLGVKIKRGRESEGEGEYFNKERNSGGSVWTRRGMLCAWQNKCQGGEKNISSAGNERTGKTVGGLNCARYAGWAQAWHNEPVSVGWWHHLPQCLCLGKNIFTIPVHIVLMLLGNVTHRRSPNSFGSFR